MSDSRPIAVDAMGGEMLPPDEAGPEDVVLSWEGTDVVAVRLPQLAEMAGLSVYQFDQRIRSLFHVTAGQYLVKVRIDAACDRLAQTNEVIAQIALSCG